MAYLTRQDLETHLQPEVIKRIIRDYTETYANLAAFPATGVAGKKYVAQDTGKTYQWVDTGYVEITTPVDIVSTAIASAIKEAKGYLRKYDLLKLFGNDITAPTVVDEFLKRNMKTIACWHLLLLANGGVNQNTFKTAYEDVRDNYLKEIREGNIDPEGWPYVTDDTTTDRKEGSGFYFSSNDKREQHW